MSEHENGNFVLKFGQNQQKHQPFMAISDFALLYRIRQSCGLFRLLSYLKKSPLLITCACGVIFHRTGRFMHPGYGDCLQQEFVSVFSVFSRHSKKRSE